MSQIENIDRFKLIEIKSNLLNQQQLEEIYQKVGNYESLINKRATLYKERGLKNKNLSENDCKELLLEHYTFLARPVIIYNEHIFVGNSKKVIEQMLEIVNQ